MYNSKSPKKYQDTTYHVKRPKKEVYCLPWARCTTSLNPCSIPTFHKRKIKWRWKTFSPCKLYRTKLFSQSTTKRPGDLLLVINALDLKLPSKQPCTNPCGTECKFIQPSHLCPTTTKKDCPRRRRYAPTCVTYCVTTRGHCISIIALAFSISVSNIHRGDIAENQHLLLPMYSSSILSGKIATPLVLKSSTAFEKSTWALTGGLEQRVLVPRAHPVLAVVLHITIILNAVRISQQVQLNMERCSRNTRAQDGQERLLGYNCRKEK